MKIFLYQEGNPKCAYRLCLNYGASPATLRLGRKLRLLSASILLLLLLNQLPALGAQTREYADDQLIKDSNRNSEPTYLVKGKGGQALNALGVSEVETVKLLHYAEVDVIGSFMTGSGRLDFEEISIEHGVVRVNLYYQITGSMGMELNCRDLSDSACSQRNITPAVHTGRGTATIRIGSSESQVEVLVVVEVTNDRKTSESTYKVMALSSDHQPILDYILVSG